jgi:hypothetical protein
MRLSRLRGIAALVVTLAAACGSTPKPTPGTPPVQQVALDPEPEASGTPVPAPVVTLIDAGSGPKAELRYAPKKGARSTMNMQMTMEVSLGFGGSTMPSVRTPPMLMTMEGVITRVGATTFDMSVRVTGADVDPSGDPAMVKAMRPELLKLVGMVTTMRMDRLGRVQTADVSMPGTVDASTQQFMESMRQSMSQATAPFPDEPVGAGARWTVASTVENSMMSLSQKSEFELVDLKGDQGTAVVKLTQEAPPQIVHPPNTAGTNVVTKLDSMTGTGKGKVTFDLVAVAPIAFELTSTIDMAMTVTQGTTTSNMTMGMGMGVTMSATPAAN